jgi:transcriptional regulator GlxA family with amidase domain
MKIMLIGAGLSLILATGALLPYGYSRDALPGKASDTRLTSAGTTRVAFVLTQGATMIDFAGPWEVFQDVVLDGNRSAFELFTVGVSTVPIRTSGGMSVTPDYAFNDAPPPGIVVIPAQRGGPELRDWLRKVHREKSLILSVCTGAFQVAAAGLLDGKAATTHHDFYHAFAQKFPAVKLQRGLRYVKSDEQLYTAGGLSSGIDLALHVVERLHGRDVAQRTADYMEYQGSGWKSPASSGTR